VTGDKLKVKNNEMMDKNVTSCELRVEYSGDVVMQCLSVECAV
jgi:hypothetical protein